MNCKETASTTYKLSIVHLGVVAGTRSAGLQGSSLTVGPQSLDDGCSLWQQRHGPRGLDNCGWTWGGSGNAPGLHGQAPWESGMAEQEGAQRAGKVCPTREAVSAPARLIFLCQKAEILCLDCLQALWAIGSHLNGGCKCESYVVTSLSNVTESASALKKDVCKGISPFPCVALFPSLVKSLNPIHVFFCPDSLPRCCPIPLPWHGVAPLRSPSAWRGSPPRRSSCPSLANARLFSARPIQCGSSPLGEALDPAASSLLKSQCSPSSLKMSMGNRSPILRGEFPYLVMGLG